MQPIDFKGGKVYCRKKNKGGIYQNPWALLSGKPLVAYTFDRPPTRLPTTHAKTPPWITNRRFRKQGENCGTKERTTRHRTKKTPRKTKAKKFAVHPALTPRGTLESPGDDTHGTIAASSIHTNSIRPAEPVDPRLPQILNNIISNSVPPLDIQQLLVKPVVTRGDDVANIKTLMLSKCIYEAIKPNNGRQTNSTSQGFDDAVRDTRYRFG